MCIVEPLVFVPVPVPVPVQHLVLMHPATIATAWLSASLHLL